MKKHITIGIAGHVDHGKTTLVRCLTGIDTDRMAEEKRRGLTIEPGIAPLTLPSGEQVALVDVPGHTDFLKNTVRGLNSVDMAILVVAADDGIMPQTREHLETLNFFNADTGLVVLSKTDLVDDEIIQLAEMEIHDITQDTFLEGKPLIPFSSVTGSGKTTLLEMLQAELDLVTTKSTKTPFRLWIDQVRRMNGFGTIVSGTILSGQLSKDDPVELYPGGIKTRVRFLESHGERQETAVAGQRVGINLNKVSANSIRRGMTLLNPGKTTPGYLANVQLSLLNTLDKPITNRQRLKLYLGTSVTNVMVVLMEQTRLLPGKTGLAQFRFPNPLTVFPGDRFALSLLNVNTIIGGGRVLEIPKIKFNTARANGIIRILKPLQTGDMPVYLDRILESLTCTCVTAESLSAFSGFSTSLLENELTQRAETGELISLKGKQFIKSAHLNHLKQKILTECETALKKNTLQEVLTRSEIDTKTGQSIDEILIISALNDLCKENRLIRSGTGFSLPHHCLQLSDYEIRLTKIILKFAQESGMVPFSASSVCAGTGNTLNINKIKRLMHFLHNQNRLIRLNNKRFIGNDAMDSIRLTVTQTIKARGKLVISDSMELLGYGRSMGIPVFEYLDSIGFTKRIGDYRVLANDGNCSDVTTKPD